MTRGESEGVLRGIIRREVGQHRAITTGEITEAITRSVNEWLRCMGAYRVNRESPVLYESKGRKRKGRVDVTGIWQSGARMAIEIDRSAKPRSLKKLQLLKQAGWKVAWVRWDVAPAFTDATVPCIWVSKEARMHFAKR